jgi:hypothetical protein
MNAQIKGQQPDARLLPLSVDIAKILLSQVIPQGM